MPPLPKYTGSILLTFGALTFLLFQQTLYFEFLYWDDHPMVVRNPVVLSGFSDFSGIFSINQNMRFMPVTWILCKALIAIFGLDHSAFHLANVSLHAFNSVMLAYLFLKAFQINARRDTTLSNAHLVSALAFAALWAWHPMRVEPVSWVTAITYHTCTAFFLIALFALLEYICAPGRGTKWELTYYLFFTLSVCSYALAYTWAVTLLFLIPVLLSKQQAPRSKELLQQLSRHWRIIVTSGLIAVPPVFFTIWARFFQPSAYYAPVDVNISIAERLQAMIIGTGYLFHRMLLPFGLTPAVWDEGVEFFPKTLLPLILLSFLGIALMFYYRSASAKRARWLLLATFSLAIPVINPLENSSFYPQRYAHLLQAFMLFCIVLQIAQSRISMKQLWVVSSFILMTAPLSIALVLQELPKWKNSSTLFDHIEQLPWANKPYSSVMLNRLRAGNYVWEGDYQKAIPIYNKLIIDTAEDSTYWHQIGVCHFNMGDLMNAQSALEESIKSSQSPNPQTMLLLQYTEHLLLQPTQEVQIESPSSKIAD